MMKSKVKTLPVPEPIDIVAHILIGKDGKISGVEYYINEIDGKIYKANIKDKKTCQTYAVRN